MTSQQSHTTRRRFLGTATASVAGLSMLNATGSKALSNLVPDDFPSTEHFWYRLQPPGPYIDSQCNDFAFGYENNSFDTDAAINARADIKGRITSKGQIGIKTILFSEDNGRTWPHVAEFPDAGRITFSHIFKNGNVIFGVGSNLYLSTDKLKTFSPVMVKNTDGSDYIPHTPQNSENPGWYFHALNGVLSWDVNGTEMLVWGNYCNVLGGAAPVNIYYSVDQGRTVKIAYSFGQNPFFTDNGSPGGGRAGALLGNPDNSVLARHVHCVTYNPTEDAFYACTGDLDRGEGKECHWLRGTYSSAQDEWDWRVVVSDSSNSRYKSGGICFHNDQLYWVADANGAEPYDRGVFRCDPQDLANPDAHTKLFNPGVESANMIIQDGVILASHCAPASPLGTGIIVSLDGGETWAQHDLAEFGKRSPVRFQEKNGEGWFRMDLRSGWISQAEVLFIKPKSRS
jgi:hypothetical protein